MLVRTFPHALAAAVLLGAPLALAAGARSAPASSDPFGQNDDSAKEPYRKAIKYGVAEYEAQRFDEALGYFRRAHEIFPNARTLRGIGMASFELRDYVTAMRSLKAALEDGRKPLSPEQRKETQELIERCQNFIAVYRLRTTPADAEVTVDTGAPELEPDGSLVLGLGPHLIEGRAPGHVTRTVTIQVRGRERQELLLALDRVAPESVLPSPVDPSPQPMVAAPAAPSAVDNRPAKVWLWTGGGLAALAVGAGIYWGTQSRALASCRAPQIDYRCDNESTLKLERDIGAVSTIVTGAAAVAALTIGVLSWKSPPSGSAKVRSLACAIGPFDVTCGGSF